MRFTLVVALASALLVNAGPIDRRSSPSVQISSGNIVGSSDGTVDSFKGIPFAQPPVGNLRLKPPQPINGSLGTVNAVGIPRACPQPSILKTLNISAIPNSILAKVEDNPFFAAVTDQGEDCLTLNVQRPSTASSSSSKLPVLVWIFGGGFEFGSTQLYDGTSIIKRSIDMNAPIMFVAMNYRVGGFGFLAGKELQADGSTNLGLRDQRLALQWVQDNIAAFGGDPTQVTLWGESAGAISTFDHTIINGGDISYNGGNLFRAAMMDSGSITPADPVDSSQAQAVYDTVVSKAGCSSASDTLACLRSADYGTFAIATDSNPSIFSYRSVDLSYLPRPDPTDNFFPVSPEIAVENDKYAKVPVLIGDQEDEGTLFAIEQFNLWTRSDLVNYLTTFFPGMSNAQATVQGLVDTYPEDLGVSGSPFDTGLLNDIYPQFKTLAAILGDVTFTLIRRVYLSKIASSVPTWSYLSTYFYGTPVLGTFHATDLVYAFGFLGDLPIPTVSIQSYYISFVNKMDPNALGTSSGPLINWPNWTDAGRAMLSFNLLNNSLISDNFREATYQYISSLPQALRV